jgi:hypothetical protein
MNSAFRYGLMASGHGSEASVLVRKKNSPSQMWGQASPEAHKKGPDRWSSDELRHHGFALNNWFCANLIVFVSAGMISSPTPRVQGGMADTAAEFQVAQFGGHMFLARRRARAQVAAGNSDG